MPLPPTDSVQPVSMSDMLSGSILESAPLEGDDFQSLLPLLPGVVRDGNGRLRIRGGQPTQGALQISSASLIDPSSGDFDLDLPAQSVAIGGSAGEPVCRRVWPLLHERDADSDETRDERVGDLPRKPAAAIPRALEGHSRVRATAVGARSHQEGPHLPRTGHAVSLRGDPGQEPSRRARDRSAKLRLVHACRQRPVRPSHPRRRPDSVSSRSQARHDEHVSSDRGRRPISIRAAGRPAPSTGLRFGRIWSSRPRCRSAGSRST